MTAGPKVQFIAGEAWARRWDRAPKVGDKVVLGTERFVVERVEKLPGDRYRAFVAPSPIATPESSLNAPVGNPARST